MALHKKYLLSFNPVDKNFRQTLHTYCIQRQFHFENTKEKDK
jgi:hypothetical protein